MNYYEELGLRPDASFEEIRQAYRSLARVLHPDQQLDPGLRRLADGQMKRLNQIHEILTDPLRRRDYDAGLARELVVVRIGVRKVAVLSARNVTLFAAGITIAVGWWGWKSHPVPAVHRGIEVSHSAPAENTVSAHRRHDPVNRRAAMLQRTPVPEEDSNNPGSLQIPESPPVKSIQPALPATAVLPLPEPPSEEIAASSVGPGSHDLPKFGGTWFYVRPKGEISQPSEYPAEYVETVISEQGTQISGRYRARYSIADRPISAEVVFRFGGSAEDDSAKLRWTGAGGAEGEVKMVLLSGSSMQLDWMATSLGTQLGLASGSAVLKRREEK